MKINHLTIAQAAKQLGASCRTMARYCQQGDLRSTRHGNSWLINPDDLKAFVRPVRGWPAGKKRKAVKR